MVSKKTKKVLLCGYGNMGKSLAEDLVDRSWSFVVLDSDPKKIDYAFKDGIFDARLIELTDEKALQEQGIGKDVYAIFCVTNDEAVNLFVTLIARSLDPNVIIIARSVDEQSKKKLYLAGANKVIDPYDLASNRIASLLKKPTTQDVVDNIIFKSNRALGESDINIAEILIPAHSFVSGRHLKEIDLRGEYSLLVIGLLDHEMGNRFIFNASGYNHKIDAGDMLVVLGSKRDISAFERKLGGTDE